MSSIIYIEVMDCQSCLAGECMTLLSHSFKVRHFILAAALTTGLGFVNYANAQKEYEQASS
ncbi:hypothetical protein [Nitrosospira multiformis]|jgi:hypothetical protein|uniref:hypothetical protein n=1 Tax=Nitrosospira multiformis TaxID=1231 RepID=UPI00115F9F47|nr:hypothetical protein [Nitrosospira multiformis]